MAHMKSAEQMAREMLAIHDDVLHAHVAARLEHIAKSSVDSHEAMTEEYKMRALGRVVKTQGVTEGRAIRAVATKMKEIAKEKKAAEPKKKRGPPKGVKRGPRKAKETKETKAEHVEIKVPSMPKAKAEAKETKAEAKAETKAKKIMSDELWWPTA